MADLAPLRRPWTLTAAAVLTVVEGLAALTFGVLEVFQIRAFRAVVGVGVSLIMIAYAALLLVAARALLRGRRWGRGPVVATQLILLPVAWSFRGGQTTWAAVVMIIAAASTLITILHPRSTRALVHADEAGSA